MRFFILIFKILLTISCICNAQSKVDTIRDFPGRIQEIIEYHPPLKTICSYNSKGFIESKTTYKNSQKHGYHITYFDNGSQKTKAYYEFDILDGIYEVYDDNEHIIRRANYVNNKLDGNDFSYFEDGSLKSETLYSYGKKNGFEKLYYKNQHLKEESEYLYDILINKTTFYENGNKESIIEYSTHSIKVRHQKLFDENGNLKVSFSEKKMKPKKRNSYFKDFEVYTRHGQYLLYKDGVLLQDCYYNGGEYHGKYLSYFPNGNIKCSATYHEGEYLDKFELFYENGTLREEANYSWYTYYNGQKKILPTGWKKSFTPEGKLIKSSYKRKNKELFLYNYNNNMQYVLYKPKGLDFGFGTYHDGQPSHLKIYIDNIGIYESFLVNGQTRQLKQFENNKNSISLYLQFDPEGHLIKTTDENKNENLNPVNTYSDWLTDLSHSSTLDPSMNNGDLIIRNKKGNIKFKCTIKDKLLNGDVYYYFPDGTIQFKATYVNNIIHGYTYALNLNRDTIMSNVYNYGRYEYKDEIESGKRIQVWYDSLEATIKTFKYYSNGHKESFYDRITKTNKKYNDSGILIDSETPHPTDKNLMVKHTYYDNGVLESEGYELKTGGRTGENIYYYPDGKLKKQFTAKGNYMDGPFVEYNKDGSILSKGTYLQNKKHGLWLESENGILKEYTYKYHIKQGSHLNDKCYCADKDFVDRYLRVYTPKMHETYEEYLQMHIDITEPISKNEFNKQYYSRKSRQMDDEELLFRNKVQLDLKGKGDSKLILNPCYTEGFLRYVKVNYIKDKSNPKRNTLELFTNSLGINLDVSAFNHLTDSKNFLIKFTAEQFNFSQNKGLETIPNYANLCFNTFNLGSLTIKDAKGNFLNKLEDQPQEVSRLNTSIKYDLNYGIMGVSLKLVNASFKFNELRFHPRDMELQIAESYIYGTFNLPVDQINQSGLSIYSSNGVEVKTSIEQIRAHFIDQGFTNATVTLTNDSNYINIKFIITE